MINFKDKKYVLIFILSVFISVTTLIGGSYALIQRVLVGTNTYSMRTGNFLVEFGETQEITLSNQVPVYDNVGMSTGNEFTFSVTNNGNYVSSYSIKIEDLSTDDLSGVIRYAINYGNGYSYDNVHALVNNKFIIQNKSLEVGGTDSYSLRFWLDIDATEQYIGKIFSAKVVAEATQSEYKYGTNILDVIYNQEDKEGLVAIGSDGNLYSSGLIKEYRYSGNNPKNYVWFNCDEGYTKGEEHCEKWRIIGSFTNTYENGVGNHRVVKLIRSEALETQQKFNTSTEAGANFEGSKIQNYLNSTYYNKFSKTTQGMLIKAKWNIGDIKNSENIFYNYEEELEVESYNNVGLLNSSDYGYASDVSLWETVLNTTTFNTDNNWLHDENALIINTPNLLGTKVYYIGVNGLMNNPNTNLYDIKPVVYLKPDVSIIDGYGTNEEPYELSIKYPMNHGTKTELKMIENAKLYDLLEYRLANNLLEADSDGVRFVSGDKVDNNYVWYSGKMWRIVALNSDGTIKLMTDNNMTTLNVNTASGNINYSESKLREWLNNDFVNTLSGDIIADSIWDVTIDETKDKTKPETTTTVTDKVGLLTLYEYYKLANGKGKNYLYNGDYWWVLTPYSETRMWGINTSGNGNDYNPNSGRGVRPVVNLKSSVTSVSGEGTKSNPYILNGDIETANIGDKLNTRISGEYVFLSGRCFRIIGIENGLTKLTLMDYNINGNSITTEPSIFGDTIEFTTTSRVGIVLNDFYRANISTIKNMIATNVLWYQGPSEGIGRDYKLAKTGTGISAPVGLPYFGEMFASNLDVNSTGRVWTMTKYDATVLWTIGETGIYYANNDVTVGAVRPCFYLKENVTIKSGNGTKNSPFYVECANCD